MNILASYSLGDMVLDYLTDDENHVGLRLLPAGFTAVPDDEKDRHIEPLVQLHCVGDPLPNGYGNGITLATTSAVDRMKLLSHTRTGSAVITCLSDGTGRDVTHTVIWNPEQTALRVRTTFTNRGDCPVTLDLLSSVNIGGLTPLRAGEARNELFLRRARSAWSAEGRMTRESLEELQMETCWTRHALRIEKFGQKGSMPVRGFFPFVALEDAAAEVTWALQLACPSSWQIEARRRDPGVALMASLGDGDFAQWRKTLSPGESFTAPEAYLTVGSGDPDLVFQRLQSVHAENWPFGEKPLPVLFNEYCTTWGNPSHENLSRIAETLDGHDIDTLVMDSGWYCGDDGNWSDSVGDWVPNEKLLFPHGLKATADMIRGHGMEPGIWFEMENCAPASDVAKHADWLLHRDGAVIDTDGRHFLDMRKPEVTRYLDEKVAKLLRDCGFGYIKVDYNDCIGVGCDGAESLGEGLRQSLEASRAYFSRLKELVPGLTVENCASGGHRLEPSMLAVSDLSSFSDAHECSEIPVIAANLHRLMLPGQSQIWAVLRKADSLTRTNYSLVNTLLGVMCLSGDIYDLSEEQWAQVDKAVRFYRETESVIRRGVSRLEQKIGPSWRDLTGYQIVDRLGDNGERLVVLHRFGGNAGNEIAIDVSGFKVTGSLRANDAPMSLTDNTLTVPMNNFDAAAIHLVPVQK